MKEIRLDMVSPAGAVKGSCGSRAMGCHDKDGMKAGLPARLYHSGLPMVKPGFRN